MPTNDRQVDTIKDAEQIIERRNRAAFKAQVLAECSKPEASLARIAKGRGLSANLLCKRRRPASAPHTVCPPPASVSNQLSVEYFLTTC